MKSIKVEFVLPSEAVAMTVMRKLTPASYNRGSMRSASPDEVEQINKLEMVQRTSWQLRYCLFMLEDG